MKTRGLKNISGLFYGGFMVVLVFFSAAFIILHADHDCTGDEHCPICLQIHNVFRLLKSPDAVSIRAMVLPGFWGALAMFLMAGVFYGARPTTVTLKVRMNN
jgi:uncharacterized membrane protein